MDPRHVVEKCTTEIIDHFHLPRKICFPFIKKVISWVYVAGWEEGVNKSGGVKSPVIQMDEYGNIIDTHKGIRVAAKKAKTSRTSISNVLRGKQHLAGGFTWKIVTDPDEIHKILHGWQDEL